ncbi:MAG: hypothetical protein ABIH25_05585 [Candidatus Woesearchaeota archaeon]
MKNIIIRLIAADELAIAAILEDAESKKKIPDVPNNWQIKVQYVKKVKPNSKKHMDMYLLLKKLDDSSYTAREEFRKHITMAFNIDGKKLDVDVPLLTEYFKKTKEFIKYVEGELG